MPIAIYYNSFLTPLTPFSPPSPLFVTCSCFPILFIAFFISYAASSIPPVVDATLIDATLIDATLFDANLFDATLFDAVYLILDEIHYFPSILYSLGK